MSKDSDIGFKLLEEMLDEELKCEKLICEVWVIGFKIDWVKIVLVVVVVGLLIVFSGLLIVFSMSVNYEWEVVCIDLEWVVFVKEKVEKEFVDMEVMCNWLVRYVLFFELDFVNGKCIV